MVDETILWQGKSGANYKYWIYPLSATFEAVGGNYIFAKETRAKKFELIYIGEADDLSEGLTNRLAVRQSVQRNGATHIHAHSTPGGPPIRGDEVSDLISNYDPHCNRHQSENREFDPGSLWHQETVAARRLRKCFRGKTWSGEKIRTS